MQTEQLLTVEQIAQVLEINAAAIETLVSNGQIPYTSVTCSSTGKALIRFNPKAITSWLREQRQTETVSTAYIRQLKEKYLDEFPETLTAIKSLAAHITTPRQPKGYSLSKVAHKELGFVYYVRYIVRGKLIPSRWSTHTNDLNLAKQFAVENRDRILAGRGEQQVRKRASGEVCTIMETYYEKDAPGIIGGVRRGKALRENTRQVYQAFMVYRFVPYLKTQGVSSLAAITTPFLARFQNYLLSRGLKPQTINHGLSMIRRVFDHLLAEGYCEANPCTGLAALKIADEDITLRGCYDVDALRGVFNRRWKDETSYLLNLLIYSTDMRNCEIARMQVKDLIDLAGVPFINIPKSKTRYGARIVPVHPFVHRKLLAHVKRQGKHGEDYVFGRGERIQSKVWKRAYQDLGAILGYDTKRLAEEHITFYSGRHFWKTMMNAEDLGDVEEYFMGHRVTNDVSKRYNHRDKQGQKKIIEKAREVFAILDKRLFRTKAARPDPAAQE